LECFPVKFAGEDGGAAVGRRTGRFISTIFLSFCFLLFTPPFLLFAPPVFIYLFAFILFH
jgi:hypothetical protein